MYIKFLLYIHLAPDVWLCTQQFLLCSNGPPDRVRTGNLPGYRRRFRLSKRNPRVSQKLAYPASAKSKFSLSVFWFQLLPRPHLDLPSLHYLYLGPILHCYQTNKKHASNQNYYYVYQLFTFLSMVTLFIADFAV